MPLEPVFEWETVSGFGSGIEAFVNQPTGEEFPGENLPNNTTSWNPWDPSDPNDDLLPGVDYCVSINVFNDDTTTAMTGASDSFTYRSWFAQNNDVEFRTIPELCTDGIDTDSDGIGDACECGDISGDGFLNTIDARLIQRCAVGEDLPGICSNPLCDATGEGDCNTIDARLVQRFAVGELTKDDLHCAVKDGAPLPTAAAMAACGLGFELALLLAPLTWLWRRRSLH